MKDFITCSVQSLSRVRLFAIPWITARQASLLLLLSPFSRVRLCATPLTEAHQAPLSLGFSRQEHWSGLPFPSPMYESEKWKGSHSVVSKSLRPHGLPAYQAPPSKGFSRQEYWSGVPLPSPDRPPYPSPNPGVHWDSRPSSQWCHPAISSSVVPFSSCPQSLPASESFSMSQLFAWGGQSTGVSASASFPPKKSQGWSP